MALEHDDHRGMEHEDKDASGPEPRTLVQAGPTARATVASGFPIRTGRPALTRQSPLRHPVFPLSTSAPEQERIRACAVSGSHRSRSSGTGRRSRRAAHARSASKGPIRGASRARSKERTCSHGSVPDVVCRGGACSSSAGDSQSVTTTSARMPQIANPTSGARENCPQGRPHVHVRERAGWGGRAAACDLSVVAGHEDTTLLL
ncbi:hypothetical protein C8Q80DRAFT_48665 [Daedaleopsis nitida]|nr:hypothetical protein C8Q80DRAFT_48665 [Daedaleopsis nitida]